MKRELITVEYDGGGVYNFYIDGELVRCTADLRASDYVEVLKLLGHELEFTDKTLDK